MPIPPRSRGHASVARLCRPEWGAQPRWGGGEWRTGTAPGPVKTPGPHGCRPPRGPRRSRRCVSSRARCRGRAHGHHPCIRRGVPLRQHVRRGVHGVGRATRRRNARTPRARRRSGRRTVVARRHRRARERLVARRARTLGAPPLRGSRAARGTGVAAGPAVQLLRRPSGWPPRHEGSRDGRPRAVEARRARSRLARHRRR